MGLVKEIGGKAPPTGESGSMLPVKFLQRGKRPPPPPSKCSTGQLCKYNGIKNPLTEPWDYDTFVVSFKTVLYILHFSDKFLAIDHITLFHHSKALKGKEYRTMWGFLLEVIRATQSLSWLAQIIETRPATAHPQWRIVQTSQAYREKCSSTDESLSETKHRNDNGMYLLSNRSVSLKNLKLQTVPPPIC